MLSNRLFNPTPFHVDIPWDKGVHIKINPDGHYDLTNAQLVDFQPGQPGSETIQNLMNDYGIFLRDTDLTFEAQALSALRACRRAKNSHYEDSSNRLRNTRAAAGIVDNPDALEETFRQLGLVNIREQVKRLDFRVKTLEAEVASQKTTVQADKMDPDRTLIFVDPPKVFETPFALKMFLAEPENKELKKQYDAWRKAMTKEV
jgi:hypothetical protein